MKDEEKAAKTLDNRTLESDYEKIVRYQPNLYLKMEWYRKGDYFQKLSIYDNSYSPVRTSGSTTLIDKL